jgi:hypothetical protein
MANDIFGINVVTNLVMISGFSKLTNQYCNLTMLKNDSYFIKTHINSDTLVLDFSYDVSKANIYQYVD